MTKAELRAWAKEYAPDLLGSALLAEPAGSAAPALAPDWETWRQVPKAELWEAVALSCNIKPEALPRDLAGILARELLPTHFPTKDTHQEFARRLTIAKRSTGAGGTLQTVNGSNDGAVGLAVFATWAVDVMRWAVPAELAALAEPAPESAPAGEAATVAEPMQRQRYQEQEILRVLAENGYTATALPKPPKNNRLGGPKAIVRAALRYEGRVFDKAWERLRANGEIRDA